MIIKELHKRILAIVLLCLFIVSTSGVVLFYHFCQHAHVTVYSFYVDETEDLCAENALAVVHSHNEIKCCNHHHEPSNTESSCCSHHQSHQKVVKLNNTFSHVEQQKTPRPHELLLLYNVWIEIIEINKILSNLNNSFVHSPPETPVVNYSGRDIITLHHSFKIDC